MVWNVIRTVDPLSLALSCTSFPMKIFPNVCYVVWNPMPVVQPSISHQLGVGWNFMNRKSNLILETCAYSCDNKSLTLPGEKEVNVVNLSLSGWLVFSRNCAILGALLLAETAVARSVMISGSPWGWAYVYLPSLPLCSFHLYAHCASSRAADYKGGLMSIGQVTLSIWLFKSPSN